MKNKINPFFTTGYGGPNFFCDREQETKILIEALKNNRNIALICPRRLGKTAFILHAFERMKSTDAGIKCFYIDIFSTSNRSEFINMLANAVVGKLDSPIDKVISEVTKILKHCRPTFSLDTYTGAPSITLNIIPENESATLKDILDYLNQGKYQCYVAIDEFQQITEYPQQRMDAELRSYIQFTPNVHFIFAGSKQHMMNNLFSSPDKPFFQSVQKMGLTSIEESSYFAFAKVLMKNGGKVLSEELFHYVYNFSKGITWYIQDIMSRLYEIDDTDLKQENVSTIFENIRMEGETSYKDYFELLPRGQRKLMKAVAKEDVVSKPYDLVFMNRNDLTAVSSVKQALDALLSQNIVAKSKDGYYIYDRYLSLWLRS